MTFQKWIKTPKGYVTIALISYLIIASIGSMTIMGIKNSVIAIWLCIRCGLSLLRNDAIEKAARIVRLLLV